MLWGRSVAEEDHCESATEQYNDEDNREVWPQKIDFGKVRLKEHVATYNLQHAMV